jgi:hypothetical protein
MVCQPCLSKITDTNILMTRVGIGLWALHGFSIQSAGLVERQSDGTNLQGVAVLPNYSLVTFALVRI